MTTRRTVTGSRTETESLDKPMENANFTFNEGDPISRLPFLPDQIEPDSFYPLLDGGSQITEDDIEPPPEIEFPGHAYLEGAEHFVHQMIEAGWKLVSHHALPKWLKDNDFLLHGHRPQLDSFKECFKSVFAIHTETGNIWTHLLGFLTFIVGAIYFVTRPSLEVQWQEKVVFSVFFIAAIVCLGFSWLFHTVYCHSERVGKFFSKLDYCGIAVMILGSFVPWLYYSFYCRTTPKMVYMISISVLGLASIIVSLLPKFGEPEYRPLRAGLFLALGLSGVVPAIHFCISDGFYMAVTLGAFGWLVLMALLYIVGALLYAMRIPERFFPGKCDIWGQSHQIFHIFVVAAAFVHYHGVSKLATYRLTIGDCLAPQELY
ncbi:PREDICTED: adiponectin receptor protein-like [Priapulus caudatus]|uniref:Adiponectin receptor protein-like n=1 Tax=Priapulus caudatus TaxID=37621 RepID=A0ABM1DUX1_PRICU|nr:PREDICTED: adiponectin receptor protein-like [Priapulus caudatus]